MKLKKLSLIIISFMLAVCMAFSFTACKDDSGTTPENPGSGTANPDDGNGETTDPVQLVAPQISLNNKVISWGAVSHADAYEVYENGNFAARQTAIAYAITQTAVGQYVYKVRAISASASYTASEYSNAVTYKVEPKVEPAEPLATPVITLTGNVITWSAIEHATAYEVYEDGVRLTQVKASPYTITNTVAGEHVYKIRAISSDTVHYSPSAFSDTVVYSVEEEDVGFTVTLTAPASFSATVQVVLYKDGEKVETKPVDVSGGQGKVTFNSDNTGKYSAAILSLPVGYVATTVRLSASNPDAEIKIISLGGSNVYKVGVNSFRVTNNDQTGADQFYYFLPEKDGVYTLDASAESKAMNISVDRSLYIDTASELNIAAFRAEAGALVEITVVGFEMGTFSFKIVEGEVEQDLRIGIGWGNKANYIFGDCARTLQVDANDYYIFEFGFAQLGGRMITITIDGTDYVFGEFDEESGDVTNWLVIPLNKGTHEVTITTTGFNAGDEFGFCVLCIYQGEELRSVN